MASKATIPMTWHPQVATVTISLEENVSNLVSIVIIVEAAMKVVMATAQMPQCTIMVIAIAIVMAVAAATETVAKFTSMQAAVTEDTKLLVVVTDVLPMVSRNGADSQAGSQH